MDKGIKTITIDEFRKLPDSEKGEMYKYMSDHDKFVWRTTCPLGPTRAVEPEEMTDYQRADFRNHLERLLNEGKISKEEFNEATLKYK